MLIDPSGRGPTMRQLYVAGIAMLLVIVLALTLLMMRYVGVFDSYTPVNAIMKTTGDGLMPKADVKYKGVLVGEVDTVKTVQDGAAQDVSIHLKPEYADSIPANVTARTVPSNVFAVNSIEFLSPENPSAQPLKSGSQIMQDNSAETSALQTTLTNVRDILKAVQPERLGHILTALAGGFDPAGRVPGSSLDRLNRVTAALDDGTPTGQDLLAKTSAGFAALNVSMPGLVNVLASSVETSLTLVEKQVQFQNLLFSGVFTTDSTNDLFARNPDLGKVLVQSAGTVFGALSTDQKSMNASIPQLEGALRALNGSFKSPGHYAPQKYLTPITTLSFTPFKPYVRADCPRYDEMVGPSCYTAPIHGDPGFLPESMWPRTLDSAKKNGYTATIDSGPLPWMLPPTTDGHGSDGHGAPGGSVPPKAPSANSNPSPMPWLVPPAPAKPGTKPTSFVPASYSGAAAIGAVLGRKPSTLEYILLDSALQGGVVTFTQTQEGAA